MRSLRGTPPITLLFNRSINHWAFFSVYVDAMVQPGRYAETPGKVGCDPCQRGQFAPGNGTKTCSDCPPGSYSNSTGPCVFQTIESGFDCTFFGLY